jgi:hypothetical protein
MCNDWILDVLSDLKAFAELNGLPALAAEIDRARLIAAVELGAAGGQDDGEARADDGEAGSLSGQRAAGGLARRVAGLDPRPA